MKHVMLDLETMGLRPDAAIVSIGACHFDGTEILSTFYRPVSLASCLEVGLTTTPSTVDWWSKQPIEAQLAWRTDDALNLESALYGFNRWLDGFSDPKRTAVWGNGANFDPVLMTSAYEALGADPPWQYWAVHCFRTVRSLHRSIAEPARLGTHHHALDDAVHQARHLQKIAAVSRAFTLN